MRTTNSPAISQKNFEALKHLSPEGNDFWFARELQPALEYINWRKFKHVIIKAMTSCQQSGHAIPDHFVQVDKMVSLGSTAQRQIEDYRLSRYACYLIVQNADPNKPIIAAGQTYFAIQTRRQEIHDQINLKNLSEDEKRIFLRNELTTHNKKLALAAKDAGVSTGVDYAIFQNHGYKGLYGGLDTQAIHKRKKLTKTQKILDHMGSTELAANLFRATQTEEKLRREKIKVKHKANRTHYEVGAKIRSTIKELGGTMPENLPLPAKSVRQLTQKKQPAIKDKT